MALPESVFGDDTIVAVSTPPGRGGIGVVRLSGADARSIAEGLMRRGSPWRPREAALSELIDDAGERVDEVLTTWFPGPHSYTAEDVVEISCHGSPAVLAFAVGRAVAAGARIAEPGEFTLRAFRNGRLDLAQAEAVGDLIEATTVHQARIAAQQLGGALSRRLEPLKKGLTDLIALLEAGIDFAEDDVPVAADEELLRRLAEVQSGLRRLADSFEYGKVVRAGITLAILGRPNVGKSSLFNRLLETDRAIVTSQAGTTRDVVSEFAQIGGIPVKLLDTAGIRRTQDVVESIGVERSWEALADADIILVVVDLSAPLEEIDGELLTKAQAGGRTIVVGNKCDLDRRTSVPPGGLEVSAETGVGLNDLRNAIVDRAAPHPDKGNEGALITNVRHERLLVECLGFLDKAEKAIAERTPHEMLLLDLYSALQPLDAITGETTTDDILNRIFSSFCIGK